MCVIVCIHKHVMCILCADSKYVMLGTHSVINFSEDFFYFLHKFPEYSDVLCLDLAYKFVVRQNGL